MKGIINLYKEKGLTSHSCVAAVRRILKIKKAGHPGTLDPQATGVLPIMVGGATRCSDFFLEMRKTYSAEATFGLVSDTQDIWGNVERTELSTAGVSENSIKEALKRFQGEVLQVPPAFSALKKDGVPYYKLARRGETVDAEARPVNIYSCELRSFSVNREGLPTAKIEVCCGRGTYIRTIINDLGLMLGCGAVMSELERTSYGVFKSENGVTLSKLREAAENGSLEGFICPVKSVFGFPSMEVTSPEYKKYLEGKALPIGTERLIFPENGEKTEDGTFSVVLLLDREEFAIAKAKRENDGIVLSPGRYLGGV